MPAAWNPVSSGSALPDRNLVQMPQMRLPEMGRDPEFHGDGVYGPDCLLRQSLDHDPGPLKFGSTFRERFMNDVFYDWGLSWRLYRWYERGGSARWLSMFIGQSIKFLRDCL